MSQKDYSVKVSGQTYDKYIKKNSTEEFKPIFDTKKKKTKHEELLEAFTEKNIDKIEHLLANGASLETNFYEAFSYAANAGKSMVMFCLEKGVDVRERDDCAIKIAARNGDMELIRYLMKKDAITSVDNFEPLRNAANNGHVEVVKFILKDMNNDIRLIDIALYCSIKNQHLNLVQELIILRNNNDYDKILEEKNLSDEEKEWFKVNALKHSLENQLSEEKEVKPKFKI